MNYLTRPPNPTRPTTGNYESIAEGLIMSYTDKDRRKKRRCRQCIICCPARLHVQCKKHIFRAYAYHVTGRVTEYSRRVYLYNCCTNNSEMPLICTTVVRITRGMPLTCTTVVRITRGMPLTYNCCTNNEGDASYLYNCCTNNEGDA